LNGENRKTAIDEELARAEEAFRAAELLYRNDFPADAVSKLYYYLLYHLRALLISKDLEPKSHEGVLRLFGLHFVKTGIFKARESHVVSKLMKYREEADYNPSYVFTTDDYEDFRREALEVTQHIHSYLKEL
jgi:uncharacterized protein (UPF0332 family)